MSLQPLLTYFSAKHIRKRELPLQFVVGRQRTDPRNAEKHEPKIKEAIFKTTTK
jgi:hypothetical protein